MDTSERPLLFCTNKGDLEHPIKLLELQKEEWVSHHRLQTGRYFCKKMTCTIHFVLFSYWGKQKGNNSI